MQDVKLVTVGIAQTIKLYIGCKDSDNILFFFDTTVKDVPYNEPTVEL